MEGTAVAGRLPSSHGPEGVPGRHTVFGPEASLASAAAFLLGDFLRRCFLLRSFLCHDGSPIIKEKVSRATRPCVVIVVAENRNLVKWNVADELVFPYVTSLYESEHVPAIGDVPIQEHLRRWQNEIRKSNRHNPTSKINQQKSGAIGPCGRRSGGIGNVSAVLGYTGPVPPERSERTDKG